ncbi:MAG: hypothetical protein LC792_00935 [Actinobacteria bacterium]|nr:hypothetical protein [Actinomycetota bacterium]
MTERHVDPDCCFALTSSSHRCTNRDGEPLRPGQDCHAYARHALYSDAERAKADDATNAALAAQRRERAATLAEKLTEAQRVVQREFARAAGLE